MGLWSQKTINENEPFIIDKTSYSAWQHQQKRIDKLEAQLVIAVEALEFYANKSNYDCDHDIGMEVSHRVILYKDQYEYNQSTYYAGRRAIEALNKIRKIGK